jgi:hypothetical protein
MSAGKCLRQHVTRDTDVRFHRTAHPTKRDSESIAEIAVEFRANTCMGTPSEIVPALSDNLRPLEHIGIHQMLCPRIAGLHVSGNRHAERQ